MKKLFLLFFVLLLSGCGSSKSAYDKVHDKLMNMTGYTSDVVITYISNKNETQYKGKVYCEIDGRYKIETTEPKEVKGNIILFDSKMIWQYNPNIGDKFKVVPNEKQERKLVLISSFIENYVKSKDTTVETGSINSEDVTILEAIVPGDNKYFQKETLTFSKESLLPTNLKVFDKDGKERIIVEFTNFEYNPKFDENTFSIDTLKKE